MIMLMLMLMLVVMVMAWRLPAVIVLFHAPHLTLIARRPVNLRYWAKVCALKPSGFRSEAQFAE
jgi:hypothetical protein